MPEDRQPITEEWLRSAGFKWSQFDRQPEKHWTLWLGDALVEEVCGKRGRMFSGADELGIELAPWMVEHWHCWLRADSAGRYHRFLHIRYLVYQDELVSMIEGLTGQKFIPENNIYGAMQFPERAEQLRTEQDRLDKRLLRNRGPWYEHEKDPDRSRPLPEHVDAAIKGGLAK